MIEAPFACLARIEPAIGVEVRPHNRDTQLFDGFEGILQMGLEVIRIVMVARDNLGGCQDIALTVGNGQTGRDSAPHWLLGLLQSRPDRLIAEQSGS